MRGGSPEVRLASGGSHGHSPRVMDAYSTNLPTAADNGPTSLLCSNLTSLHTSLRQTAPVSFSWKETGARTTAASHVVQGIAATLLVTIGLTNRFVAIRNDTGTGAAAYGKAAPDWQSGMPQVSMLLPSPTQDL